MTSLDWAKDRNRQLRFRAIAEEIEEQRRLRAARPAPAKMHDRASKVSLRAIGEDAVGGFRRDHRGHQFAWRVTCDDCGHKADVAVTTSVSTIPAYTCTECDHRQYLSEKAFDTPWDAVPTAG